MALTINLLCLLCKVMFSVVLLVPTTSWPSLQKNPRSITGESQNGTIPNWWRVIKGDPADIGEFPYQAALYSPSGFFCGGSLIQLEFILTAAHCVLDKRIEGREITVVLGTSQLYARGSVYKVHYFMVHPQFSIDASPYDIALLKLNTKVKLKPGIAIVPLTKKPYLGEGCVISGWGYTAIAISDGKVIGVGFSRGLRLARIVAISNWECKHFYWWSDLDILKPYYLCTLDLAKKQASCFGDSGGALVCNGHQVGIVSFGAACGYFQYPDVLANISFFNEWIERTTLANRQHSITLQHPSLTPLALAFYLLKLLLSSLWHG